MTIAPDQIAELRRIEAAYQRELRDDHATKFETILVSRQERDFIAALRNNAKALLDAAERDQDRKQREPDMWTEYRSANVMRGNQRLHDENTALRAEVQMLKAQVDVEHREKVETYTQNQNLKECIEGLKEHVEGLSDYIDKAKIEAQRLGRVSGEPLYEFLRRLQ